MYPATRDAAGRRVWIHTPGWIGWLHKTRDAARQLDAEHPAAPEKKDAAKKKPEPLPCSAFEGRGDGVDGQEHRQRLTVEQALTHAIDSDEAEPLVEAHGLGLGVSDDPDAADAVALFDGQGEHVPQQGKGATSHRRFETGCVAFRPRRR